MEKHEKIYVPCDPKEAIAFNSWGAENGSESGYLDSRENVIVLSVEELSNIWNAAHKAGWADAGKETRTPVIDFESYLQSKGITL